MRSMKNGIYFSIWPVPIQVKIGDEVFDGDGSPEGCPEHFVPAAPHPSSTFSNTESTGTERAVHRHPKVYEGFPR
jgi:hypothetical protein